MRLVGEYRTYNILEVGNRYCAVPQALGVITGADDHVLSGHYTLWADRREEVEEVIDKLGSFGADGSFSKAIRLVGEYQTYNILEVGNRYCAVPQALGRVTGADDHVLSGRYALWADRREDVEGIVDRHGAFGDFNPLFSPVPITMKGPPEVIEIEPIQTCNLRCIMCHVSFEEMSKTRLDLSFLRRLVGLEGKWAKLGSMYEPVAHPNFAEIVLGLSDMGMKIDLTSNGTLFTPKVIDSVKECNFQVVTISFDGARRETYEKVRRGADYDQAMERILAFKKAVQKVNPNVLFQINFTVMRSNIDEIVEAIDMWESHGFDHLGFISMVLPVPTGDIVNESPEPVLTQLRKQMLAAALRVIEQKYRITLSSPWFLHKEVRAGFPNNIGVKGAGLVISDHPNARLPMSPGAHFQNGSFPGMQVDCRSPFKFVRINFDGAVRLCQKFSVGSIYDDDLLVIWNSQAAEALRTNVQEDVEICHSCEYFKFCIRAGQVNYDDPTVFSSNERIQFVEMKYLRYNIVSYGSKFYIFPYSLRISPEDLVNPQRRRDRGIEVASSLEAAQRAGQLYLWKRARAGISRIFSMHQT